MGSLLKTQEESVQEYTLKLKLATLKRVRITLSLAGDKDKKNPGITPGS